jgi:hypothetical protein
VNALPQKDKTEVVASFVKEVLGLLKVRRAPLIFSASYKVFFSWPGEGEVQLAAGQRIFRDMKQVF